MTIGRRNVVAVAGVTLVLGAFAGVGASPARAELPAAVRSAAPADQYKADIGAYVKKVIDQVKAADAKSGQARDELCKQVESTQVFTPSASFQTIYVSAVLNDIGSLQSSPDVLTRLNAAIIVSRLCEATGLSQLSDAALKALSDQSPAVSLWGLKAARALLPKVLAVPLMAQNQKLTPAIIEAVKAHHDVAALVQDAYDALSLPQQNPPLPASAFGLTAAVSCDLLDLRIAEYKTGQPANPLADRTPLLYFVRGEVSSALTKDQRIKVTQAVCNLMVAAARRAATVPAGANRDDLYSVVSASAGYLQTLMRLAGNTAAVGQFNMLLKLPGSSTPKDIVNNTVAAVRSLSETADYKTIKPLAE